MTVGKPENKPPRGSSSKLHPWSQLQSSPDSSPSQLVNSHQHQSSVQEHELCSVEEAQLKVIQATTSLSSTSVPTLPRLARPVSSPKDISWNFPLREQLIPCLEGSPPRNLAALDLMKCREAPWSITEEQWPLEWRELLLQGVVHDEGDTAEY